MKTFFQWFFKPVDARPLVLVSDQRYNSTAEALEKAPPRLVINEEMVLGKVTVELMTYNLEDRWTYQNANS